MSVKRKVWVVCMACMIGCFSVSAQQRIEPADLPILAWYGIPAHEATVERFEELRDAGFTLNFRSFPSADAVAKGLDAAEKAGVKLIIGCPELEKEPEKTVRRFMNHSALAGYFLRDEPRSNEFAELGEWARRIQAVDNEHFCYLNLFPTGPKEHLDQLGVKSYREYVSRFDEQVPLPFLTFDHYPITRDGLKAEWYENLEEFSDEARKAGKPFWAFALATSQVLKKVVGVFVLTLANRVELNSYRHVLLRLTQRHRQLSSAPARSPARKPRTACPPCALRRRTLPDSRTTPPSARPA